MQLIAIGKLRAGPERELFERYAARLRPPLAVRELAEARGSPEEIRRREGEAMLAAIPPGAWTVALDLGGEATGSVELAGLLERWLAAHTPTFLIGGAEGLSAAVLSRADAALSFGPQTWPHMLVRVMLAEQLFRAQSIRAGHPYHRALRPVPPLRRPVV